MQQFIYPAILETDDDGVTITFPDVPEAITCGDSYEDALISAADCLDEAIAGRIDDNEDIPEPSAAKARQPLIAVPALTAAKAAVYLAAREARIKKTELAKALSVDEKEARRILDPRHKTKLETLERALHALGKRFIVTIDDAA